jgi:hypothetical protein
MALDNNALRRRWGEMRHPLCQFFFDTQHTDLEASTVPARPFLSDGWRMPAHA